MKNKKGNKNVNSFSLAHHPFFLFNHIFLYRGRELNRALGEYDLDYSRWRVLSVLNECPNCTMQVLAETAGVDRTSLTHTVRLMVDAGLISKATRQSDRRSVILSLTEQGVNSFAAVLPIIVENSQKCFAGFSNEEVKEFINVLRRVLRNVRDTSETAVDEVAEYDLLKSLFLDR